MGGHDVVLCEDLLARRCYRSADFRPVSASKSKKGMEWCGRARWTAAVAYKLLMDEWYVVVQVAVEQFGWAGPLELPHPRRAKAPALLTNFT